MRFAVPFLVCVLLAPSPLVAQEAADDWGTASITPENLRARLFAFAHDSMGGRISGTEGNVKATDYMAAEFAKAGLEPAGDDGTYFQTVPLGRLGPDPDATLTVSGEALAIGDEVLLFGRGVQTVAVSRAVYAGNAADSTSWITGEAVGGRLAVLTVGAGENRKMVRGLGRIARNPRFAGASGVAIISLDLIPPEAMASVRRGQAIIGEPPSATGPIIMVVSPRAGAALLGAEPDDLEVGAVGPEITGHVQLVYTPFDLPSRNVVAVLRGSDPEVNDEYIALTAHNDHIWVAPSAAEHDSIRAVNRITRPLGADSPARPPSDEEWASIHTLIDSLRSTRPPRADTVGNGADDDGSGSVSILEIARALAARPDRPRRSILFVSHTAEEMGLLGSRYFTDNPTVPRASIVVEIDQDMVGRGSAVDLPDGGPGYLEIIGSRRVSVEFGDILEQVNGDQPEPFEFNYAYDAPGHPLQYYCRADHYSYARHNIPSVALSRGEHIDYHQLTDEAEYIDYDALARVARFVHDAALTIANLDHRPVLNQPTRDPNEPCVQ